MSYDLVSNGLMNANGLCCFTAKWLETRSRPLTSINFEKQWCHTSNENALWWSSIFEEHFHELLQMISNLHFTIK